MITRSHIRRMAALTAGLAATGALLVPAPASAATAAPAAVAPAAADPSDLGPRLERACLRIPNMETRTANLIRRLEGDAETRGSLLWLQAAIDRATESGRTDLAEVLTNRLAVREATLEALKLRLESLIPSLKDLCAANGVEV
jgi:hypothetical protein